MSEGGMMKRLLLYVIPLSAIAVLVFATIAVAQSVPQGQQAGQEPSQNPATGHTTDVQNSTTLPAKNEPAETKESAETKEPAETTTPAKSTAPATDTTVAVDIKDLGFAPPQLNIAPGTRIMFVNSGKQDHTATADNEVFDTGTLKPGESTWVSFRGSGSVTYHDQLHPDMKGSIVVGKDGGGGDTTAAPKQTAEEAPNEPSGAADQSALDLSKILKGIN
jgi:plastocyanin